VLTYYYSIAILISVSRSLTFKYESCAIEVSLGNEPGEHSPPVPEMGHEDPKEGVR